MQTTAPEAQDASLDELVARLVGRRRSDAVVRLFPTAHALLRAGPGELRREAGLTGAQATRLAAAAELGRRAMRPPWDDETPFCDPESVWLHYRGELAGLEFERLLAVALDAKCKRLAQVVIAEGQLTRCVIEPAQVFRPMLRAGAVSLLLLHNHPSGDPAPSAADVRLTRRLAQAGRVVGIGLADHVIVGRRGFHSMADDGMVP